MGGLLYKKKKGRGAWHKCALLLPPVTGNRGGMGGARRRSSPVSQGEAALRPRGKRGRAMPGSDSPPQFQRRGPVGRSAAALSAVGRRRPRAARQGRPEAGVGGGKGRGWCGGLINHLGSGWEGARGRLRDNQRRRRQAVRAAALGGQGGDGRWRYGLRERRGCSLAPFIGGVGRWGG